MSFKQWFVNIKFKTEKKERDRHDHSIYTPYRPYCITDILSTAESEVPTTYLHTCDDQWWDRFRCEEYHEQYYNWRKMYKNIASSTVSHTIIKSHNIMMPRVRYLFNCYAVFCTLLISKFYYARQNSSWKSHGGCSVVPLRQCDMII